MYWFHFLKQNPAYTLLGLLVVVCAFVWSITLTQAPLSFAQGTPRLTFAVLNIGQGDSLYIEGPTGIQVLVDAGPGDGSALRELPKVMPPFDRSLNAVVATHPDSDHTGGFIDILKRYEVGAFIEPGIRGDTLTDKTLEAEVDDLKIPRYIARRGMVLELGGGAQLHILYPDVDVSNYTKKTNDGSIVAHLVYGTTSVLLTADAPFSTEDHLLAIASSTELKSDILKVGHHGSKYSSGDAFVQVVAPHVAIISVGKNNRYGHPAPQVLDTLTSQKIPTLRTDQSGTIICTSDGVAFHCSNEK